MPKSTDEDEEVWITVRKDDYDELQRDSDFLYELHAVGVEQWIGYEYAKNNFINGEKN